MKVNRQLIKEGRKLSRLGSFLDNSDDTTDKLMMACLFVPLVFKLIIILI